MGHTTAIRSYAAAAFALLLATGHAAYADDPENTDWPLLGNAHEMQHHADLSQINTDTVGRLGLAWWVDLPAIKGMVGNPLISDGRIFQSGAGSVIYANDLRTGEQLWTFDPRPGPGEGTFVEAMGMNFNRGVALHGELVIVGTGDCRLVAVDQETGARRWEAQACDQGNSQTITAAPRVGGGMVFTGNACGDSGMSRGHVDAFDADTGRHAWRFYTVPGDPSKPPESDLYRMAAATWGDGWYERTKGCGSVWDAMVYDPGSERLYIGVGGRVAARTPRHAGSERGRRAVHELCRGPRCEDGRVRLALQAESGRRLELRAGGRADACEPAGRGRGAARGRQRAEGRFRLRARRGHRGVPVRAATMSP